MPFTAFTVKMREEPFEDAYSAECVATFRGREYEGVCPIYTPLVLLGTGKTSTHITSKQLNGMRFEDNMSQVKVFMDLQGTRVIIFKTS